MPTIKDVFQLLIGTMLEGYGYSHDTASNMIHLGICMWTANPFIG